MNAKEALKRLLNENLKSNKVSKFYDIVWNALNRLEKLESQQVSVFTADRGSGKQYCDLEKENKSLIKELKKQDKELVGLTRALKIIKEYILKDMTVFGNELNTNVYLEFKCGYDSVYYELPFEKFCEIKEYLK